jgi:hypothetical protein
MARLTRWAWPPGTPRFPLTVVGHGQLRHHYLTNPERLVALAGAVPVAWGLLFVLDARGRRWTLYSPDPEYTAMLAAAAAAGALELEFNVMAAKLPGWNSGWRL